METLKSLVTSAVLSTTLLLSACNTPPSALVRGGNGSQGSEGMDGSNKPHLGAAPHFDASQFKKDHWIQWKRISAEGIALCERWTFERVTLHQIELSVTTSSNCADWDPNYSEKIIFEPKTGLVRLHEIKVSQTTKLGELDQESIFPFFYGSLEKVEYKTGSLADNNRKYPAFQITGQSQVYLNHPDHPFHAAVLQWREPEDQKSSWTIQVVETNPALPVAPAPAQPAP